MRDGEKKSILINSVIVPVTASGMVNFFSLTSFILKMDYLHFQAFYIIYIHIYTWILQNAKKKHWKQPFKCTPQLFLTTLDHSGQRESYAMYERWKKVFEVTVGDTGSPTAPWAQALEEPRAALDAAWDSECKGQRLL